MVGDRVASVGERLGKLSRKTSTIFIAQNKLGSQTSLTERAQ